MCGVNALSSVVGRGNGGGSGPYGVHPYCKKKLVTQLSNIVIKLEKMHT
jgi:hypothetical protein